MSRSQLVPLKAEGVVLEVLIEGDTPSVVLVPSARRGAADFAQLATRLHQAGFGSVAVNMRGVGGSSRPTASVTASVTSPTTLPTSSSTSGRGRCIS